MRNYLQQRKYKRNGSVTSGAYFYQRRVPKDLRHRTDIFKSQFIEEYLGTTDRTAAGRKVSAVNEKWERIFDAMRRDEKITEEQLERIRLAAQFQAHGTMMADPLDGPNEVADALEQFLPNVEADSRKYLERAGLDCSERNLNEAMRAIWIGTVGAQALFNQGLTPAEPPSYEPLMFDTSGPGGPTILEAAEAYEKAVDVTTTEKTRRQLKQSARLFADHVGQQKPVTAVSGRDAVAWLDRLAKINPDYRRDPKSGELTLAELEEFYPSKEGKGLSAATINRHAGHLRVLIGWLIKRHELSEEHRNPFAGKSRSIKNWNGDGGQGGGYLPMSNSEIAALLKDAMLGCDFGQNFNACIGWLVLIGAFTGARAGELCALTKDDVREKDELPFIAIRSGKTENAARVVPLHPQLIEAGFLEYVATCQDELFGITGKTLSKRFPAYRRDLGVDRPGVVFHSLRKSFVSGLEDAEVPSDTVAILVGHKSKRSFTFDVYSPHGPTLRKLAEAVAKVRYEGLNLSMDGQ